MANYHYNDKAGCSDCSSQSTSYTDLSKTSDYSCDQECICRFSNERSNKDKMDYNYYVLGKPMGVLLDNKKIKSSK